MTTFRRAQHVAFRSLGAGEGGVLLHLSTGQYHSVNDVGALLWELLDGRTAEQVAASARTVLEGPPDDLPTVVEDYLGQLAARGLVETGA